MIGETVTARILLALLCLLALAHLSGSLSAQPRVISGFGAATGPEGYPRREGAHQGVDLAAAVATSVIAPADGVVDRTIQDDLCGNGIVVSHGALATVYCHLSEVAVHAGQSVRSPRANRPRVAMKKAATARSKAIPRVTALPLQSPAVALPSYEDDGRIHFEEDALEAVLAG